jgi:WD40 repeat protein
MKTPLISRTSIHRSWTGQAAWLLLSASLAGSAASSPTLFESGPNLNGARMNASFARHPDGRVFIFGGHGPGFTSLATAEVWRPATSTFSSFNMNHTHDGPAIARLNDGRLLLAGGASNLGVPAYANAEIFNPADESFTPTGNMVRFRAGTGAATLADGRVLVASAWWTHNTAHTFGELFDPTTGQFAATGRLTTPRASAFIVPLKDGSALVLGGTTPTGGTIDGRVERFDPQNSAFNTVQDILFTGESGWSTVGGNLPVDDLRLADGRFVNVAIRTANNVTETTLFTVDPSSGAIAKLPLQPALPNSTVANFYYTPILSQDRREVFLLGNRTGTSPLESLLARIDPTSGKVVIPDVDGGFTGYFPSYAAMAALSDGRLLVAGGTTGNNFQAVARTGLITPGSVTPPPPPVVRLMQGPAPVTGRQAPNAARLNDGRLIFFGGHGRGFVSLNTAEIWNPTTDSFTQVTMNHTHDTPCFTRLADGRFLLAGGSSDLGIPNDATSEIYDPSTGRFTSIGNMVRFRAGGGAVQLTGGKVLIAGAWWIHNDAHTYGELLDLGTSQFSQTGPLNTPRAYPIVVATADGNALVIGGTGITGNSIGIRIERYLADQNSFVPVTDQLFPGEEGWVASGPPLPQADLQLADGRYLFLASRTINSVTSYSLFTVNPANGEIARFVTDPPLPDSSGASPFFPALNADRSRAYIAAYRPNTSPPAYFLMLVDTATGKLTIPDVEPPDVPGYFLGGATHVTPDGRLMVMSGSERPDNFSAVAQTTVFELGTATPELPRLSASVVALHPGAPAIQLSWPESASDVIIESAEQFGATWQTVTAERTVENGLVKTTIPIQPSTPSSFFRLRRP